MSPDSRATVPEARRDPVLRRYPLRRLRVPLGSGSLSIVVPDASACIRRGDWAAVTMRESEPPYWVQIWPASVAMARLLWRLGRLEGRRALDLGCGLGLPGIAASCAGAQVTFADRQADALAFAAWNARHQPGAAVATTTQFDWLQRDVDAAFDLLLLADVSYRPVHHGALRRHAAACFARGGVVVHADPQRRESTPFVRWLQESAYTLEAVRPTAFLERRHDVRLCVAAAEAASLASWRQALGAEAPAIRAPGS